MFFYPSNIFHFHSFDCHLGSQLGSLWQKCDPDRCDQNSHKNRLCFFTQQTFLFSFLWLSLGDPTLILVAKVWSWQARQKSHKSRLCFFRPTDIFHFLPFGCHLKSQLGSLWEKRDPRKCDQNLYTSRLCLFLPSRRFPFSFLCCRMGSQLRSLLQKWDPDKCDQNSHKSRLCFLPNKHCPFSFLSLSLGVPTKCLVAKVWSWQVRLKLT